MEIKCNLITLAVTFFANLLLILSTCLLPVLLLFCLFIIKSFSSKRPLYDSSVIMIINWREKSILQNKSHSFECVFELTTKIIKKKCQCIQTYFKWEFRIWLYTHVFILTYYPQSLTNVLSHQQYKQVLTEKSNYSIAFYWHIWTWWTFPLYMLYVIMIQLLNMYIFYHQVHSYVLYILILN